jgi:hypothetical protein
MSAPQPSDQLTLEECLRTMRRLGTAPEDYVVGYHDGFLDLQFKPLSLAYMRGREAGLNARLRGAHGAYDGGAA